ncbi:MAG TPA: SGNH/GDSL hydrolase family protein [Solirubrobacteraceae bacterium]|nr:SGNH/GDSL hydrolase family protein [Solirubrobacteraceae bacterium]
MFAAATCLTSLVWAMAGVAHAVSLGGTAEVRSWASAPALHDPVTIRLQEADKTLALPGDRVFRYLNAAAGPATGPLARYSRYVWEPEGIRGIGADTWSIATGTTGRALTLRVAGGPGYAFRFRVNGSLSAINYLPQTKQWKTYDITIRFRDSGRHTVIFQMTGIHSIFNGAFEPGQGHLFRPALGVGPRTIFLGDSWTAGAEVPAPFLGYVQETAQDLGLGDAWASGIGGTGYTQGGIVHLTWGMRLQSDVLRWQPATVIFAGSANDLTASPADLKRAVTSVFDRTRRALPHARLIAVGPWLFSGLIPPGYLSSNEIIRDAITKVGGAFIDNEGWITGTGSTAQPSHDGGNASTYIGIANHPSVAGYRYIGARLAAAIGALPPGAGLPGSH